MDIRAIRELSNKEIAQTLEDQKRSLMNLRFRLAARNLSDTNQLSKTRKIVARILTVQSERRIVQKTHQNSSNQETI